MLYSVHNINCRSVWLQAKPYVYALLFAIFVSLIPFDMSRFPDKENVYKQLVDVLTQNNNTTSLSDISLGLLTNEPLWIGILLLLGKYLGNMNDCLMVLSFFSIFCFTLYLYKKSNSVAYFIFLLNPLTIDLFFSQIRSAVAMSFLLLALLSKNKYIITLITIIATLIHAALAIISLLLLLSYVVEMNKNRLKLVYKGLAIISGISFAVILAFGREIVLGAFGDRRVEYDSDTSSITYMLFWLFIGLVLLLVAKRSSINLRNHIYCISCLVMAFLLTVFNVYSSRFIALSIPFVVLSVSDIRLDMRIFVLFVFVTYQVTQWYYWL